MLEVSSGYNSVGHFQQSLLTQKDQATHRFPMNIQVKAPRTNAALGNNLAEAYHIGELFATGKTEALWGSQDGQSSSSIKHENLWRGFTLVRVGMTCPSKREGERKLVSHAETLDTPQRKTLRLAQQPRVLSNPRSQFCHEELFGASTRVYVDSSSLAHSSRTFETNGARSRLEK